MDVPNGLLITWDAVSDISCAGSPINYSVTVMAVRDSDGMVFVLSHDIEENEIEITNILQPSQNHSISVRARTVKGSCVGVAATIVCETTNNLSPGIIQLTLCSYNYNIHTL